MQVFIAEDNYDELERLRRQVQSWGSRHGGVSITAVQCVAESMVILLPILQLGWRSASSFVTFCSSCRVRPKNGPPEEMCIRDSIIIIFRNEHLH